MSEIGHEGGRPRCKIHKTYSLGATGNGMFEMLSAHRQDQASTGPSDEVIWRRFQGWRNRQRSSGDCAFRPLPETSLRRVAKAQAVLLHGHIEVESQGSLRSQLVSQGIEKFGGNFHVGTMRASGSEKNFSFLGSSFGASGFRQGLVEGSPVFNERFAHLSSPSFRWSNL